MKPRISVASRLLRAFLLQGVLVGIAGFGGVVLAVFLLEDNLIREALEGEAEHFWTRRAENPAFSLPDTLNMRGYLSTGNVPKELAGLGIGFHSLEDMGTIFVSDIESADMVVAHVSERSGTRLYLVFAGERVLQLATVFGLAPLAVGLLTLYLVLFISYRLSHSAVSPIMWLAREVNRLDPEHPDAAHLSSEQLPDRTDAEVATLAAAIEGLAGRVSAFVHRERLFTRDASHELRSPLTVVRAATEILLDDSAVDAEVREDIQRIARAAVDMEGVIDILLLLAREDDLGLEREPVSVNDVLRDQVATAGRVMARPEVGVRLVEDTRIDVLAPRAVVASVFGNLLRNAMTYTRRGEVQVHVATTRVTISDTGIGMDGAQLARAFQPYYRGAPDLGAGLGVGLSIVRRLCDRFGWAVDIVSERGHGTVVVVHLKPVASGDGRRSAAPVAAHTASTSSRPLHQQSDTLSSK
jgi:signal transduction histidine kinase